MMVQRKRANNTGLEIHKDNHTGKVYKLPTREGVYLVKDVFTKDELIEIDVYRHPIKGLSCFCEDFGSSGTEGVNDATDCHVSVQNTGLEFISRVRNLD